MIPTIPVFLFFGFFARSSVQELPPFNNAAASFWDHIYLFVLALPLWSEHHLFVFSLDSCMEFRFITGDHAVMG